MKINRHYGIIRPLNYENLIAGEWEIWGSNQMGILDLPMFLVLKPRLEGHAEKCLQRVKKVTGRILTFSWMKEDGMLSIVFLDEEQSPTLLKDHLKYSNFPKYTQISARKFLEIVYEEADESVLRSPDFVTFTDMMMEDFQPEQIENLVKGFPWLMLVNARFKNFIESAKNPG